MRAAHLDIYTVLYLKKIPPNKIPHKTRTSWHKVKVHKVITLCTFELVNAQGSAILLRTREVHKGRSRSQTDPVSARGVHKTCTRTAQGHAQVL